MSMSSLGQQLAAMHSKSTLNPGSILTTSKRKSDIVGRGISHSAQHGHALKKSNFKPSVIHEDAKAAADVPLSTLRENAFTSMHQLVQVDTDFDHYLTLVNLQSLQSERGLLTREENEQLNKTIRGLLNLIGSVLQESSSRSSTSIYSSCLHVIEYLLRRYDIHICNAQDFIVAFLPYHHDVLFARILQLVDLASMPTFSFLRPYSAAAAPASGHAKLNRSILAKQASKDAALLKIFCQMAQQLRTKQNRGAAVVTSFCCAVVVESLTLAARATTTTNNTMTGGSLSEATVRTIMSYCLQACAWKPGGDWRAFGYVVVSTVCEHAELSGPTVEKVAHAILKGVVDVDALALLMTILPKTGATRTLESVVVDRHHTPKHAPSSRAGSSMPGFELSRSVFEELCRIDSIHTVIGQLSQHYRVTRLVATLLDMGLKHNKMQFVMAIITTPALNVVWKESSLISSVAATAVNLSALEILGTDEVASLLHVLKQIDAPSQYDKGIAYIVEKYRTTTTTGNDQSTRERIAKTLGVNVTKIQSSASADNSANGDESLLLLLPPRVALEHADASVRKVAMEQLVEEYGHGSNNDHDDDGSLLAALLRHFVMEEEMEMKLAAASAIDKLLLTRKLVFDKDACDLVIQAISQNSSPNAGGDLESIAVKFAGQALKSLMVSESHAVDKNPLLVILVAHCESVNGRTTKGNATVACHAICSAFSQTKNNYGIARKIIATNPMITAAVVESKLSPSIHKKALVNLMMAIAFELDDKKSDRKALQMSAWKAINLLVEMLSTDDAMEFDDLSFILKCIQAAVEKGQLCDAVNLVSAFAQIPSDSCYNAVSIPVLKAISSSTTIPLEAIIFEIAARATLSSTSLVRLINLARESTKEDGHDATNYLVHILILLGHSDYDVRKAVLQVLDDLQARGKSSTNRLFKAISSEHNTSILMDGAAALPSFLRSLVVGKKSALRHLLLEQCVDLASSKHLPLEQAVGSMHAIAVLLSAGELAGEASFPLLDRWSLAGSKILDILLATSTGAISSQLIDAVVRMLKGALVHDPSELLGLFISSGPSKRGTRARSYSVGRSTGVSFIDQYPEEMSAAIEKSLDIGENPSKTGLEICITLIRDVLSSESWCESVFKQLARDKRVAITSALLNVLHTQISEDAIQCMLHLPLDAADVNELIQANGSDLQALAVLTDHVRLNAGALGKSKAVGDVSFSLFEVLRGVSSPDKIESDDGGIAFAQISILHALSSLVSIKDAGFPVVKQKDLVTHTKLLVKLVGSSGDAKIRHLASWKGRKIALALMSRLCALHPSVVVKNMVQAMLTCINAEQINSSSDSVQKTLASIGEVLASIIPVFHEFRNAAKMSLIDVLNSFLDEVDKVTNASHAQCILKSMTDALALTGDSNSVTRFFCLLVARATKIRKSILDDVVNLASSLRQPMQAKSLLGICSLTNNALLFAADAKHRDADEMFKFVVASLFCKGTDSKQIALRYCRDLCGIILLASSLPSMQDFIENANDSNLCLQLWQDLLLLQSTAAQVEGCLDAMPDDESGNKKTLAQCMHSIDEALSVLQHSLPIPVFLASTTSLIEDVENGGLRTKALRFLAERASGISSSAPEASLFLDLLPLIVGLTEESRDDDDGMMLYQSAVIVIEQFARVFCMPAGVAPQRAKPFLDAFSSFTSTLSQLAAQTDGREMIANQLACSLALSISTLVRLLKARCLPMLPKLVDSLLGLLADSMARPGEVERHQNELVQMSMLRAMISLTENIPQFLIPHLDKVLAPTLLPSYTMEDIDLVASLGRHVPSRQLLPAVTRALKKCSTTSESSALLKLTNAAVGQMPRTEIGAVTGHVLNSILYCCENETALFDVIGDVLLSLVMKLSENQLRPVYARLRAWRGDENAPRRFAFWSLSAALSKELKSIFLPYLSTVVSDALRDLNMAVSVLCASRQTKKPKIGTVDSLQYLPALLACLGHSFAADAREGGNWIREDGEDRYALFREPLSALLLSRVPSDFPFVASSSGLVSNPYNELIVNDGGVISCLVSLASAAGNDSLWKPLNHAVLAACSYEERVEVQRAGLMCLHKLMQTLGEEYMVLLPECLPVLSELLEADEGTAAIARECVELSEEFLGESLEDSLR